MKVLVGAFNQEKALVGAFSVIVKPMDRFTALIRNDVVPMLIVYAGVGVLLGIVELITIVLACAYVAQIGRRVKRDRHTHRYTQPGPAGEEEYLPSLNAKETNF